MQTSGEFDTSLVGIEHLRGHDTSRMDAEAISIVKEEA